VLDRNLVPELQFGAARDAYLSPYVPMPFLRKEKQDDGRGRSLEVDVNNRRPAFEPRHCGQLRAYLQATAPHAAPLCS